MPGLSSTRVVLVDRIVPATVWFDEASGRITRIGDRDDVGSDDVLDVGDLVLMPGAVDIHVHINEPGRTEWEGFETATRAAAAGGVTTMLEMPLNAIPATTSVAGLEAKLEAMREPGKLDVDVGLWGGVVPGNTAELRPLWEAGVWGFKCFLVPSGVDEFAWVQRSHLEEAMPVLAELGAPLLVHAEVPGPIERADRWAELSDEERRHYEHYLASRPPAAEAEAIGMMLELARETGCHVHIVHLASRPGIWLIANAKNSGVPVTTETCPHYLTFAAEDVPDGATEYKCAPPIRERETREALWEGLRAGIIDAVVTDHSPSTPALKELDSGRFDKAWGGIASIQFGVAATWTSARDRQFSLGRLAHWTATTPADIAGLGEAGAKRKGRIAVGYDADLVVFDSEKSRRVVEDEILHRHKCTPYAGRELTGVVVSTWLRGKCVYDADDSQAQHGRGTWLSRADERNT